MTTEQVEEIIQFLTKYGLNDSHILHNKDIIAKDFVDRYNKLVKNDLLHSVSYCECTDRTDNWYDDDSRNWCFDCEKEIKDSCS